MQEGALNPVSKEDTISPKSRPSQTRILRDRHVWLLPTSRHRLLGCIKSLQSPERGGRHSSKSRVE